MTECSIKPFYSESSGGGSNVWITHEGVRYYSRLNAVLSDNPGQRNLQIMQFHKRREAYARNASRV